MQNHEMIGDYTILNRLALGGMAEILLAKRQGPMGFAKPVVLKRLLPQLAADQMFTSMFLNEAKLAARLNHPNIVQINDLGQSGASFYIAMEYLAGEDLATVIRVLNARKNRLPKNVAARIVADAAGALHYAHQLRDDEGNSLGIVHRDVSPQNIFVTTQGIVKVVDFGIAKCEDREVKTQTGIVKGKIEYMPPEQMTGQKVDHRADIYALGVVLYEALCGSRPVDSDVSVGDRLEGRAKFRTLTERMPDVDKELARIVTKATSESPKNRHQTADELREELDAYLEATGIQTTPANISKVLLDTFGARHVAALDRRLQAAEAQAQVNAPQKPPVKASADAGTQLRQRTPLPTPPPAQLGANGTKLVAKQEVALADEPKSEILDLADVVVDDERPAAPTPSAVKREKSKRRVFMGATAAAAVVLVVTFVAGREAVGAFGSLGAKTSVHVSSTPSGAAVFIDDVAVGTTPLDVTDLAIGVAVDVRISAPERETFRETFVPSKGAIVRAMHATLAPLKAPTPAVAAVNPVAAVAAATSMQAEPAAPVPAAPADDDHEDEPGLVATAFNKQAPAPAPAPTKRREERPTSTQAALSRLAVAEPVKAVVEPGAGFVSVTSDVPMRVYAGNRSLGMTPVVRASFPEGPVTLRLSSPAEGLSRTVHLDVPRDGVAEHRVVLDRGKLSVHGASGANVYVGTRKLGQTPIDDVPLVAGDYVLMVEQAGSTERERVPVTVEPGQTRTVQLGGQ